MTDVTRWLEQAGLGQYADLFERRNIDFHRLIRLTERELLDFGLAPAPRQALLRKLEVLALAGETSAAPALSVPAEKAERRQLTIMFCDLVNSVGLSSRLDPEDLRDVIAAYQRACAQSIRRYNGYVARYLGDGLLICFGYPAAHEDDAERAVRAGLDLVEAVAKLHLEMDRFSDLNLRVRVGIATGLVVVGDVIAEGISDRDAVSGEAANLAARLQELASPNRVIVSAMTRQLAAESFEYNDLGARNLKGFAAPVAVYEVIGERQVTRLEARSSAPTPFVGRGNEIGTLLQCWERAASGDGQVVILAGEAGIGKSRIAAELQARVRRRDPGSDADRSSPVVFQCSPYHTNAPLYPVVRQLERLADIGRFDTDQEKLGKLEIMAGSNHPEPHKIVLRLGGLLGLGADQRGPDPPASPAVRRHLTIEALTDWCVSRAKDGSPMIVFEDVQWIDPTTRLLLTRLANKAENARILITITLRTGSIAGAQSFLRETGIVTEDGRRPAHVTVCEIRELGDAEVKQLAAAAAAGRPISQPQFDAVLTKSEGIPLYVEELIKVVANGMDLSAARAEGDPSEGIPNTIRDALMAQLDQQGHAKETAQHASVIGQEFSVNLLAKITKKSIDQLSPELNQLINSNIVLQHNPGVDVYRFKHALVRDISYQSLLRKDRRQIHLRIAGELAGRLAEAVNTTKDLVAQHYSLGEDYLEAIRYWQEGAKEAISRSAHEEALGMLRAALADFRKLRGSKRLGLELELVLAEAMALRSLHGYAAPEVEERLIAARELCAVCADTSNRFNVEWGLFQCTIVKGNIAAAHQLATDLYRHAERHPDRPFVDAHLANGMVAVNRGDFAGATRFLEKGVSISRPETDPPHFLTHGQNPGLFCLSYLARTQCFLGFLDQARTTINRGLTIAATRAHDLGHIYGHVNVLIHAVRVYHLCGDLPAEKRLAHETMAFARRHRYAYYEAMGACHLGWVTGAEGCVSEGIDQLVSGIATLAQTGTQLGLPGFYILLSRLFLRAGRLQEASEAFQKVVDLSSAGMRLWDADIERVRGDFFLLRSHPDLKQAENAYRLSMAIARRQSAGLLMFKAGLSLARLLQSLDRRQEGYDLLKLGLEELHEGFDTQDARDAQMMLKDLAGTRLR